jgi:uncharacterized membrane protein
MAFFSELNNQFFPLDDDILAFSLSCFAVLAYYAFLSLRTHKQPGSSIHTLNAKVRKQWVAMIMKDGDKAVLAVQTLRNSVMAANFMASTAVILIIGVLNLSEKIAQWLVVKNPAFLDSNDSTILWQFKLGVLLLDFSIAFYCFSMAIRFFNHVGYMINLPADNVADGKLINKTYAYLNRAGRFYTYGNRTFYLSLPIIFWFLGPLYLLFATTGLIAGLALLDRAPD